MSLGESSIQPGVRIRYRRDGSLGKVISCATKEQYRNPGGGRGSGRQSWKGRRALIRWDKGSRNTWVDFENLIPVEYAITEEVSHQVPLGGESRSIEVADTSDPSGRIRVGDRVEYGGRIGRVGRFATVDGRYRVRVDWPTNPESFSWAFPSEVVRADPTPGTWPATIEKFRRVAMAIRSTHSIEVGSIVSWASPLLGIKGEGLVREVRVFTLPSSGVITGCLVEWDDTDMVEVHGPRCWIPIEDLEYVDTDPAMVPVEATRPEEV